MAAEISAKDGKPSKLYELTASQALALLKSNKITVEEYARSLLQRIKERDDAVKAWAFLNPELVIEQAKRLDQIPEEQRGPLHGIAIGVKDIMNTKDMPTEFNSPIYKGNRPAVDATSVGVLRNAGALIFGKTTTTEYAGVMIGTKTQNPHDPSRTPGGSSSGSAAVVGDMQVPLSLGTQTLGSVIRPASFNGIFGMKPTYNSISPEGQKMLSLTVDTFGFFARSIDDLRLLADVFDLKDDDGDDMGDPKNWKFAFVKTAVWKTKAGPGTVSAMEQAVKILRDEGVTVEEISLPTEFDDVPRYHERLFWGDARVAMLKEYRLSKKELNPILASYVENEKELSRKEQLQALDKVAALRPVFDEVAQKYTAIITPSAVDEAPLGLDSTGDPSFNTTWTSLHVPVVNIPAFTGSNNMPIGISLVGGRYKDQHILEVGKVLSEMLCKRGGWIPSPSNT